MYNDIGLLGIDMQGGGASVVLIHLLAALIAYLMGSINPSLIQAKLAGVDIRKEGSGNPGTTNTLRVLGKKAAAITLCVDILKGVLAVVLAGVLLGQNVAMTACFCVFVGHVYPVFYGFNGGKGVATAFGSLAAIHPAIGFGCLLVVVLTVLISRYVSLGSITGAIACPILSYVFLPGFTMIGAVMALIVIWRHKTNIQRLLAHEENKLTFHGKYEKK